ncbi:SH3 domain-containing protein [Clostridium sp. AM58-1XD]|uniref:SH3 domain-containing protein n=1 Tax=Clostridium sp. AM58-1XD TaxID=2292307 RepID=UPI001FA936A9|nr:SH3 domain-containing protein [Clostridium sp. AM58-1XD]
MKKLKLKRGIALAAGLMLALQPPAASMIPLLNTYAYTEKSGTVNASTLNVRSGPGTANSIVTKLSRGASVVVVGEETASDGALWYKIRFTSNGREMTGYASKSYIKFKTAYTTDGNFEAFLNAEGFPESYKDGLRSLHAEHPQWVFRAHKTGLDWNTVIENESIVGRNLVSKNSISSWKSIADGAYNWSSGTWPGFDGSAWVAASSDIISYYMDPRNFMDDQYIFQFLLQSYDSSVHTADGLQTMLKGTFMESGSISSGGSPSGGSQSDGSSGTPSGTGPGGSDPSNPAAPPAGGSSGGSQSSGSPVTDSGAPSGSGDQGIKFEVLSLL